LANWPVIGHGQLLATMRFPCKGYVALAMANRRGEVFSMTATLPDTVASTPFADDLLRGVKPIAEFIGEDERRTYYLLEQRLLPAGKLGSSWVASRRKLREFYDRLTEGPAEAGQPPMQPRVSRRRPARAHPRRRQIRPSVESP
jgi:hypothetical protein